MRRVFGFAAIAAALSLGAVRASAQSSTFTFDDVNASNPDDGFGLKFSNDASATFTILNHGSPGNGTNYIHIPEIANSFQQADHAEGTAVAGTGSAFDTAMYAAVNAPALYEVSYDYYIDTSTFAAAGGAGTFLQVGTYDNFGSGAGGQDFGAIKEVELNGTQLASGQIFTGHVDVPFTAYGTDASALTETFYRLGVIINGDGAGQSVDFDNISVHPVPEPATLGLLGLAGSALAMRRRRA